MGQRIFRDADSLTLTLNNRIITCFAVGDNVTITPANQQNSNTPASNGGTTASRRTDSDVHDLVINIQKQSIDDVFFNSLINEPSPTFIEGSLKEDFTRDGQRGTETWTLDGGVMTTKPTDTKNDQDGNEVLSYTINFRRAVRSI